MTYIMSVIFWMCVVFILYTYFGYPVLIFLMARVTRQRDWSKPSLPPKLTLMILAYNEEETIKKKIENSLNLEYPKDSLHILVVADGSDDNTVQIVESFTKQGVELCYEKKRQGKMAAISRAMAFVRGSIVVFSDANNMYNKTALKELVAPFDDPGVGCVSGAKHIFKSGGSLAASEGAYWKYESFIRNQETALGCCTGVNGEILAIRKVLFVAPPVYNINDDFYLALVIIRQGYNVIYTAQAKSLEYVSHSAENEVERRARIVALRYQLMAMGDKLLAFNRPVIIWQIISHKFCRPLVPFAMIGAFITNLVILMTQQDSYRTWFSLEGYKMVFILQVIFYLMAAWGIYRPCRVKLFYLPAFLVNSNWAAVMGFWRFLSGRQDADWKKIKRH